jgi:hypothetical protein
MRPLKSKVIAAALIIVLWSGCKEESPFISKKEATEIIDALNISRDPFHPIKNVVAILNNDVYYFKRLDSIPKRLTSTPTAIKTNIKLSFDKTQIAYINQAGNPVIIRADNGQVLQTLTQYSYIDQMDWAKDRLTLYMLSNRKVVFYGAPLTVIQPASTNPFDEVKSFSMNSLGDQGYFIKNYGEFFRRLKYHSTVKSIDEELSFNGDTYDYIDFYDNKGNFLVGYNDPFADGIATIVCVQDYKFYPAYSWSGELMSTPEFKAEQEVLLYGTMGSNIHYIKAVYLGTSAYQSTGSQDILNKVIENYPSTTQIYLDWAQ